MQIFLWISDVIRIYIKLNDTYENYERIKAINNQLSIVHMFQQKGDKFQDVEDIEILDKNQSETIPINVQKKIVIVDIAESDEKKDIDNKEEDDYIE